MNPQKVFLTVLLLFASHCTEVKSDNNIQVTLSPGYSVVKINMQNAWSKAITDVSFKIDEDTVPNGINVDILSQNIEVLDQNSTQCITIGITISDTIELSNAVVPLIIQDGTGNIWNNSLSISSVVSNKPVLYNSLLHNYPNPFNPNTFLPFTLQDTQHTNLSIYNVVGQKVKTLVNETLPAGTHVRQWDGTDETGSSVSSGVYLYRIQADSFVDTKRMIMLE